MENISNLINVIKDTNLIIRLRYAEMIDEGIPKMSAVQSLAIKTGKSQRTIYRIIKGVKVVNHG